MNLDKKTTRRGFFGAMFGLGAAAALYSPRSHASCMPTIGATVGRIIARIPAEVIAGVWEGWNEERNKDAEEDQAEAAALQISAGDAINHVEKEIAENDLKRKTAPLPENCLAQDSIEFTNTLTYTSVGTEDRIAKYLDQGTLTASAPFVRPGNQAKQFKQRYGENWYQSTTHINTLVRPDDLNESNIAKADAFILNATTKTARNVAEMTTMYGKRDDMLFIQTAKTAMFTVARAPLIRQRDYITEYGMPSMRTAIHTHVNETFGNPIWRENIRALPSEVQGLQVATKQKAFNNFVKLQYLRELEVQLALQSMITIETVLKRAQEGPA